MRPLLGAHVSTAGGLDQAIAHATRIGAECIQIFGASPRQWQARLPMAQDVERYKQALEKSYVRAVFLHAAYLVNLATPDPVLLKKSFANLSRHLEIAEAVGARGLIFHIGSGKEVAKEEAMAQVATVMKTILRNVPGKSQLIIENSAGGGQKLGSVPEELGIIMENVASDRVKICIDTAHIFEAGIIDKYSPVKIRSLFDAFDKAVGIANIVALHVNDSKTEFNSHHDRHENIGEGHIGLEGFKHLTQEKRLFHTSWLLEVPGFDNQGPDKKNLDILKSCFV